MHGFLIVTLDTLHNGQSSIVPAHRPQSNTNRNPPPHTDGAAIIVKF